MKSEKLGLEGLQLFTFKKFSDERGFFTELSRDEEIAPLTGVTAWKQSNWSRSVHGTIRGLHFQRAPHAQAKLITVTRGKVFDVAVDIRPSSATFGKYIAIELSDENPQTFFIPVGFAHGFLSLSTEVDFLYRCSDVYTPEVEDGLRWDDSAINIAWPIKNPLVSGRDQEWKPFKGRKF